MCIQGRCPPQAASTASSALACVQPGQIAPCICYFVCADSSLCACAPSLTLAVHSPSLRFLPPRTGQEHSRWLALALSTLEFPSLDIWWMDYWNGPMDFI